MNIGVKEHLPEECHIQTIRRRSSAAAPNLYYPRNEIDLTQDCIRIVPGPTQVCPNDFFAMTWDRQRSSSSGHLQHCPTLSQNCPQPLLELSQHCPQPLLEMSQHCPQPLLALSQHCTGTVAEGAVSCVPYVHSGRHDTRLQQARWPSPVFRTSTAADSIHLYACSLCWLQRPSQQSNPRPGRDTGLYIS